MKPGKCIGRNKNLKNKKRNESVLNLFFLFINECVSIGFLRRKQCKPLQSVHQPESKQKIEEKIKVRNY